MKGKQEEGPNLIHERGDFLSGDEALVALGDDNLRTGSWSGGKERFKERTRRTISRGQRRREPLLEMSLELSRLRSPEMIRPATSRMFPVER